ncbi:hypothetical protein PspLS_07544 [Pyricularia sp. CBS 133598]|nr:hypothetical protein PspLS_07544 [Pyricularia sp. CBS 133598]
MSATDIISAIEATVKVLEMCISTYNEVKNATGGLPEVFREVGKGLPLVEDTLLAAQDAAREAQTQQALTLTLRNDNASSVPCQPTMTMKECCCKVEKLNKILQQTRDKLQDRIPLAQAYHLILLRMGGTRDAVKSLWGEILKDVLNLAANQVFHVATRHQISKIQRAIDELAKIEPMVMSDGGIVFYINGRGGNVTFAAPRGGSWRSRRR